MQAPEDQCPRPGCHHRRTDHASSTGPCNGHTETGNCICYRFGGGLPEGGSVLCAVVGPHSRTACVPAAYDINGRPIDL